MSVSQDGVDTTQSAVWMYSIWCHLQSIWSMDRQGSNRMNIDRRTLELSHIMIESWLAWCTAYVIARIWGVEPSSSWLTQSQSYNNHSTESSHFHFTIALFFFFSWRFSWQKHSFWYRLTTISLLMVWTPVWARLGESSGNLSSHRAFLISPTVMQYLTGSHRGASMSVVSLPAMALVVHWSIPFVGCSYWSASPVASISGSMTQK